MICVVGNTNVNSAQQKNVEDENRTGPTAVRSWVSYFRFLNLGRVAIENYLRVPFEVRTEPTTVRS